mmetsp:Transcript_1620/g.5279  ORF Transcript_1620/g.5279 Transcript_1620/m.5279 type:complete len:263 (-) Transcript_1620:473-1261(-)
MQASCTCALHADLASARARARHTPCLRVHGREAGRRMCLRCCCHRITARVYLLFCVPHCHRPNIIGITRDRTCPFTSWISGVARLRAYPGFVAAMSHSIRSARRSGEIVNLCLDFVLYFQQQRGLLRVQPRHLIILTNKIGKGIGIGRSVGSCYCIQERSLTRAFETRVQRLVTLHCRYGCARLASSEVTDARTQKVVLGAPLQQVVLQAADRHLFVDFDRLFEVAGRCGKVCHLEQALVGLSRGLLALVVVCRCLKGLHCL